MRRATAAVVMVTSLFLGCSDDSSEPEADTVTREEFTARVDAICADRSRAIEDFEPPRNAEESARLLRRFLPVMRDQLARIRALGEPPESGSSTYLQWFAARDGIVETTADMIDAAEEGDAGRFQELASLQQQLDEKADEAAAAYGFEVCGQSGAEDFSEDASR